MKDDVLKQLVVAYLQQKGYFTQHNIRFKPREDHPQYEPKQDSVGVDIDVLGINPRFHGPARVWAVRCLSSDEGFMASVKVKQLEGNRTVGGIKAWRGFRELMFPKWSEGFFDTIEAVAGADEFTYVTAVTKVHDDRLAWQDHPRFRESLKNNPIKLVEVSHMYDIVSNGLGSLGGNPELIEAMKLLRDAQDEFRGPKYHQVLMDNFIEDDDDETETDSAADLVS